MIEVYLDSNIYRQLGLKFKINIDFKNLSKFLEASGDEFGLLEVVFEELMDHYKNEVFKKIFNDHEKLWKKYQLNPYLDDISIPETTMPFNKAIERLKSDLKANMVFSELPEVESKLIIDFLIHNKRLDRKDNTRDFLIFYTLLNLCKLDNKSIKVLISNDEIFTNNDFFKKILSNENIKNLKFYQSITDFIKEHGPTIDFINDNFLLKIINKKEIENELMKDIISFPSYVSKYYNNKDIEVPEIDTLTIGVLKIHDYYIVKNYNTKILTINVTVEVPIKAIFKPEKNLDELSNYLSSVEKRQLSIENENFDNDGRPIFENSVLFIFEGEVNEQNNCINNFVFVDFIIDYFISNKLKKDIILNRIKVAETTSCNHEFDTENGYYKHSNYGGGLSWHFFCKKCGTGFDTGDYYD